jgi:MFS family permease
MDARARWRRVDAGHWVHVLAGLQTTLLGLATVWVTFGGLALGLAWLGLVPGALAALSGWLTWAWRRNRPWSWYAWTVLAALGVLSALGGVLTDGPGWGDAARLGFSGILLVLLCHPDSRARLDPPPPEAPMHMVPPSQRYRPV